MSRSNEARELEQPSPAPQDDADLGFQLPEPARISGTRAVAILAVGAVIVSSAFVIGWLPKRLARREIEASSESIAALVPRVEVVKPKILSSDRALVLPGSVTPLEEASIRTRANGYVRRRLVDIGDKVETGALLLEVDTPDLDQQLEQARAQLAQASAALTLAKANKDYAETTLARREKLAPAGVTSAEELDKSRAEASVAAANVSVAQANLEAQSANVRRLTQEKSFARVTAPFAGTITTRSVDKGSLVSPTAELYTLASTDPIRVVIEVPQDVAPSVKLDIPAKVTIREFPGRVFEGKVARFASALDSRSRTMTTIVHVPNPKGELLSGMYAQAELSLPLPHRVLEVPSTALLNDANGTRVAVVGADKRIHLARIAIERDTGPMLQIASGIAEGDRVVRIAAADLTEGREVEIAEPKPAEKPAGK